MIRGTTAPYVIEIENDIDLDQAKQIWLTFGDINKKEIITKTKNELEIDNVAKTLKVTLTQTETLQLNPNNVDSLLVYVQLRILTKDDAAIASEIGTTYVNPILKESEIS